MFTKKRRLQGIGLGVLVCGACACGAQPVSDGIDIPDNGLEGVTTGHIKLLRNACDTSVAGTVTISLQSETVYFFKRTTDGLVVTNTLKTDGTECTFATTSIINIIPKVGGANGDKSNNKVILDYYSGMFGIATSNAAQGIVINLSTTAGQVVTAGSSNTLEVRGTPNYDVFTFGTYTANSVTTSYGQFLMGTALAAPTLTTHTYPDVSIFGITSLVVSMGPGNDTVNGNGGAQLSVKNGTSTSPTTPFAVNMTVYGGDGNDTITSGAATTTNTLKGNAGNDLFLQQAAKAHDTLSGSDVGGAADTDTVDYSARTATLSVTLGDDATATDSYGLISCVKEAASADNDTFTINDGTLTKTFEYRTGAAVGSIQFPLQAGLANNDDFTIDDGTVATTFEFNVEAGFVAAGGAVVAIDVTGATTANDVANAVYTAINAQGGQTIVALDPGTGSNDTVVLVNTTNAVVAGQAITKTTGAALTFTGMAAGLIFTPAADFLIDISGADENAAAKVAATDYSTGAAEVAALTATAIGASTLTFNTTTSAGGIVTLAFTAAKPAGATMSKTTAAATFVITNFTAGSAAPGANDGETGEIDSLSADIENVIGGSGNDTISAALSTLIVHQLQGMAGNDTLIGSDKADALYGGVGNDLLIGGAFPDTLYGGDGNDVVQGGAGNDTMDGGGINCVSLSSAVCTAGVSARNSSGSASSIVNPGIDVLDYSDRVLPVTVNIGTLTSQTTGTVQCGETLTGGANAEMDKIVYATPAVGGGSTAVISIVNINGGAGDDTITGDANANTVWGGPGDDTIVGGAGSNTLYGEQGDDTVTAGNDSDHMFGGTGTNTMTGGTGNDFIDDGDGVNGTIDCLAGTADLAIGGSGDTVDPDCEL